MFTPRWIHFGPHAARFARDLRPSACRRWASGLYCACTQNIVYPCIHREIAALNCQLCRTWGCILQLSASLKSQWCVKLIYPCLHREIFPKIDVHFWQIHVGPSASVHSEMNTLWASAARFARARRPSAFGPSACRRWASSLYCTYAPWSSLPLYTQGGFHRGIDGTWRFITACYMNLLFTPVHTGRLLWTIINKWRLGHLNTTFFYLPLLA